MILLEARTIEGIIISEKAYGETSKILNVITKDYGMISFLAKGVKRLKSNLRSISEKFTYAEFEVSYKKDKLSTLIDANIINSFPNIKKDIEKISYLNYICELTSQVLKQSYNKNIYDILINTILKIEEGYDPFVLTNILEIKYLDFLGVEPLLDGCVVCDSKNVVTLSLEKGGFVCKKHIADEFIVSERTIKIIRMLKYVDIKMISKLSLSNDVKYEINNFLDSYYEKYTGLYLKSKEFLKNIAQLR